MVLGLLVGLLEGELDGLLLGNAVVGEVVVGVRLPAAQATLEVILAIEK